MHHHNPTMPKWLKIALAVVVLCLGGCAAQGPGGTPNYAMYNLGQTLMNNHGYLSPPPVSTHITCFHLGYGQVTCNSY